VAMSGAPVSGPGRMSRRTDRSPSQKIRELPDAAYGEAQEFNDLQKQSPLANDPKAPAPGMQTGAPSGGGMPLSSVIPLSAPTQRPDEPVTAGVNGGPGPGPEALGPAMSQRTAQYQSASDLVSQLAAASGSADLQALAANLKRGA
jgi:hypothetical protein